MAQRFESRKRKSTGDARHTPTAYPDAAALHFGQSAWNTAQRRELVTRVHPSHPATTATPSRRAVVGPRCSRALHRSQ